MTLATLERVTVRAGATVTLAPLDLTVRAGEVVVVHGPSGAGKSTLLGVLAGWLEPSGGTRSWSGALAGDDRGRWHRTAFVPQSLALLAELSLAENVALAPRLAGRTGEAAMALATARLAALDIDGLADRRPAEVSQGQQQRAAVARALVLAPALVLADEPSAHLDAASTALVVAELRRAAGEGTAVVVATHDPALLAAADRAVELRR